jgi:hypothetical protein
MHRYQQHLDDANKSGYRPSVSGEMALRCQDWVVMFLAHRGPVTVGALLRESMLVALPGDMVVAAIYDLSNAGRIEDAPGGTVRLVPPKRTPWWRRFLNCCGGGLFLLLAVILLTGLLVDALEGGEQPSGKWVMAEVTAYCPCDRCTDGDLITANGTHTDAEPYALAADKSLAFGSRIYIQPGLGVLDGVRADDRVFLVDDRGSALNREARERKVLRLDLRVRDHWWATRFGRRLLPVFIYAEVQ